MSKRVQARFLFGRLRIIWEALLDMIDAHFDSWSWILLHSTSSRANISMEEQDRIRGLHFFGLCLVIGNNFYFTFHQTH